MRGVPSPGVEKMLKDKIEHLKAALDARDAKVRSQEIMLLDYGARLEKIRKLDPDLDTADIAIKIASGWVG